MINEIMTGLGIGLAFWLVTIPTMLIVFRRSKASLFTESNRQQERSIALMEERNQIDRETVAALYHIVNAIDNNTQRMPN